MLFHFKGLGKITKMIKITKITMPIKTGKKYLKIILNVIKKIKNR